MSHIQALLRSGAALLLAASILSGCQTTSANKNPEVTAQSRWKVGCDLEKLNAYGETKRQYCWLMLNNFVDRAPGVLMPGTTVYAMGVQTIFEIDAAGLKLISPKKSDDLCEGAPRKIAIDGKRIDGLSMEQKVSAIETGALLVWEEQAAWPYCGVASHGAKLDGVGSALAELRQRWDSRVN